MSDVFDDLPDLRPLQRIRAGKIASTAIDFADRIDVILPNLTTVVRWPDCRWQARNDIDLPQRGQDCLVVIDDNNEGWVIAWWPY